MRARFEAESRELADAIVDRFGLYEYGLRGARGVIQNAGENGLSVPAFRRYLLSRDLEREFPGARGFGFIHRWPAGAPRAGVREIEPHQGERFIIELVEPIETNREAVGLDIASESSRRMAALAAMRSGRATMTAPITLVQARQAQQRSFLALLPVYRPRTFLSPGYQDNLGWGFATALGAQDARRDVPVLSINGDGGFMYTANELATAVRHRIPLTAVVFSDGSFGNVRRIQEENYGNRLIASDLANPDFVKFGESFGAAAERVRTPAAPMRRPIQ